MEKPKAMVHPDFSTADSLREMIKFDSKLYDTVTETPVFAFHFGQLANKATHYDYLIARDKLERPEVTALVSAVENLCDHGHVGSPGFYSDWIKLEEALAEYRKARE